MMHASIGELYTEIKRLRNKDTYFQQMLRVPILADLCRIKTTSFNKIFSLKRASRLQEKVLRAYVNTLKDNYKANPQLRFLSRRAIRARVATITTAYIELLTGYRRPNRRKYVRTK